MISPGCLHLCVVSPFKLEKVYGALSGGIIMTIRHYWEMDYPNLAIVENKQYGGGITVIEITHKLANVFY
jgi:hypothetical protein